LRVFILPQRQALGIAFGSRQTFYMLPEQNSQISVNTTKTTKFYMHSKQFNKRDNFFKSKTQPKINFS